MQRWWKRWNESRRRRFALPVFSGPSRHASQCLRISAGAARTRDSPRIRPWLASWPVPLYTDSKPPIWLTLSRCSHARSISSATAAQAWGSSLDRRGIDQGDTRVDEATLRRIHLQGYIAAIRAGVGSIMPSYNSWNGVKVSGDKALLTGLLKQELGFQGFLISDYNAIDQIDRDFKRAVEISINAGMDMAMVPARYKEFIVDLKQLVQNGRVPMTRIDDAVTRILRVKFAMGMMDPKRSQLADRELAKTFGSPEHRAVGRQAVRESMVLLKNNRRTLPLAKSARAHPRRGQERRRHGQPMRRLDYRLAGQERARNRRRNHAAGSHSQGRRQEHESNVLRRWDPARRELPLASS